MEPPSSPSASASATPDPPPRVIQAASATTGPVVVLADSSREEIARVLGDRMIPQASRPMAHDLDRDPEQILAYLGEWRAYLDCATRLTNCPRSSAHYNHDSRR